METGSPAVAVLQMRLNVVGSAGLVMLTEDGPDPLVAAPQPNVIYNVTTLADSQTGTCTTPSGGQLTSNCTTPRAAIIASNSSPGPNEIVFGSNGTITLSVAGQDDNAQAGDLDVTNALTIVGNGAANTIIQGGPSAGNGIDKVFSFNPLGAQPGFAVSLSGLTIQFGRNTLTGLTDGNNEGGAFDFDAGTLDGAGSLSVANCNISQNSTVNGDGGGIALFDGGVVSIINTTITGNRAGLQDPSAWYGYYGGGIYVCGGGYNYAAVISITNGSVSNNVAATAGQSPPAQVGGGIYSDTAGIVLQGAAISGNTASNDGGGLYGDGFIIGPGTMVSGNVAGGNGGGVYGVSSATGATLANNSAAYWGAALFAEGPGASISDSRILGNSSPHAASIVDGDETYGATVAAANNWWGSNASPASLVAPGIVTFSPWLVMTLAASPAAINTNGTSALTARIASGSDGSTGYQIADGTPVSFAGAPGIVSPASTTTTAGAAISVYTAEMAAGTATVSATLDSQTLTASIDVTLPPPPTLTTISPATGAQGAAVPVTLTGTNFLSGAAVAVSNPGITVGSVTVVSAARITATFTISAGASLGAANVTVTTGGGTSAAAVFTVNPPAPTLSAVTPASGLQGASVPVTLTGTNFVSGAAVTVNNAGITVGSVAVVSATQITATFTIAANTSPGVANVTVTTSGGTSGAAVFTVNPPAPTLATVSPASGVQGASVPVTLTGTNFVSGAAVAVANPRIAVSSVIVTGATRITATFAIAANAAIGPANVTVTTGGGVSTAVAFSVTQPPLTLIPVPLPDLTGIVTDRQAAIVLGKALFWDQQAGSDGIACASCHFHAGADNRIKNTLNPGLRHTDPSKQNVWNPAASGRRGPNYQMARADYPFHKLANAGDRDAAVLFDTDDVTSSQAAFKMDFDHINLTGPANQAEQCLPSLSPAFNVGGINVRQVDTRNAPTVINAVFNFRNSWDGRANNIFNGRNPFGPRDPAAGSDPLNSVLVADAGGNLSPVKIALPDASLASQAVEPPVNNLEMSCSNQLFEQIGQKLLRLNPLALQTISTTDSVLGPYANKIAGTQIVKAAMWDPATNSLASYETLIQRAFDSKYWSSPNRTADNYRQIEKNFSFFWGVAIMLYESTLVSGDSPFDQYANGNIGALTAQQVRGWSVFNGNGQCASCHTGAEFTGAATSLKGAQAEGSQVAHTLLGDGNDGLYDGGFYNIGVRPTSEDLGTGGTDSWGNPLSWARQLKTWLQTNPFQTQMSNVGRDGFAVNASTFQFGQNQPVGSTTRDAVDGSFKVPTLRNVELTGPFMHNGGMAALEEVVDFYNRGGDARSADGIPAHNDAANTTGFGSNPANRTPAILPLNLSADDKAALVAFLKSLTDERVRWEKSPFDHPSLNVPNGHLFDENQVLANGGTIYAADSMLALPAIGAAGRTTAMGPVLPFDAGLR